MTDRGQYGKRRNATGRKRSPAPGKITNFLTADEMKDLPRREFVPYVVPRAMIEASKRAHALHEAPSYLAKVEAEARQQRPDRDEKQECALLDRPPASTEIEARAYERAFPFQVVE